MKAIIGMLMVTSAVFANSQQAEKSYEEACRQTSVLSEKEDEHLFLTPNLQSDVVELAGQVILDAGCGTGVWAKALADKGAMVHAVDSNKETIQQVQVAVAMAGVEESVSVMEGNLVALPYEDNSFDGAISVYVGSELPRTVHRLQNGEFAVGGLELHMHEMARVLKEKGVATFVAPASYDVVFTDGQQPDDVVYRHIDKVLGKLGKNPDPKKIEERLGELTEVNRATFVMRDGKLQLLATSADLTSGEPIWRKEFDRVEQAFYHCEEEYLVAMANAGLHCTEIKRPCFFGNVKYRLYQEGSDGYARLGTGYIDNNPFTIYTVVKR